jgi:hypothetical protein
VLVALSACGGAPAPYGKPIRFGDRKTALLSAHAQRTAGREILVDEVVLTETKGFVIVRADRGGIATELLGVSKLLPVGTSSKISLHLRKQLPKSTKTVFVVLHADRNANGRFDEVDPAVHTSSGFAAFRIPVKL